MANVKTIPTEEQEQIWIASWLDNHRIVWWHTPNEGARKPQYRSKLKKQGLKSGIPDIVIIDRPPFFTDLSGTVVEMKRQQGGRMTATQEQWFELFSERRWVVIMGRGAEDAIMKLKKVGYGCGSKSAGTSVVCPDCARWISSCT